MTEKRVLTKRKSNVPQFTFWVKDPEHPEADDKGRVHLSYDTLKVSNELFTSGIYQYAVDKDGTEDVRQGI